MARTTSKQQQDEIALARRTQILDAAITVFAEKGFSRSTIHDVAHEAGIADGTIYLYFDSKTALLLGILDRLNESEAREEQFTQALEGDVREFFRSYLRRRLDMLVPHGHEIMQVVLSEVLVNAEVRQMYYDRVIAPSIDVARRAFDALVERGQVRPLDADLTMRTIAAATIGLLILRVMDDQPTKNAWDIVPDFLTELLFDGLAPNEG